MDSLHQADRDRLVEGGYGIGDKGVARRFVVLTGNVFSQTDSSTARSNRMHKE